MTDTKKEINLGSLEHGPHVELIRGIANKCAADNSIQAIWIGGSLAAGIGDEYSDVDFRIAVEPGQVDGWATIDWSRYLPGLPCGSTRMHFGEHALLHHLVLENGVIVDFYVQDIAQAHFEPKVVVLACKNAEFRKTLDELERPPVALIKEIDGTVVRQFLVDYWITTHKEMKALGRKYDYSAFIGLYFERMALLRAWHMQIEGKDIDSRPSLHMIGALHRGLGGKLTQEQHDLLGLPSQTPGQTVIVIDGIRDEMAKVGRWLADRHKFEYPHELEEVVQKTWDENKAFLAKR